MNLSVKKIFVLFFAVVICIVGFAQSKPYFTQYVLNNYILNPAVTGIENYVDLKVSNRNQWSAIEGHPRTTYISIHGPIGKTDYRTSATSFAVPGENPRGKSYWEEYTAPSPHHGIGFIGMNDKTGYFNRWSAYATYAYHKPISVKTTLSLGFQAGVSSIQLDQSKVVWADPGVYDPAIGTTSGTINKIKPELGAGLWLYSAKYFAGLSVLNIIPGKVSFGEKNDRSTYFEPNYFFTAGYRLWLSDDVSLMPSAMIQYWKPQLFGVHVNAKVQYMDKFWVGGAYRYGDLVAGYSAMAGILVSNTFNISYAYESATTNQMRAYTGQTHEILLGFLLNNKYGDSCPRNIW
ncbi:MAG: type IX secretion system membrane protein PorP/SprF [Chitinophagaceae bacterium]|nr:type IX secretion system membrane protein PorP/SprF [Chitinophagaceae bacterium]